MIITRISPVTGKETTLDLPVTQAQLDEAQRPSRERRYIQNIFPSLTDAERVFVKTGCTAEDWLGIFPGEDE